MSHAMMRCYDMTVHQSLSSQAPAYLAVDCNPSNSGPHSLQSATASGRARFHTQTAAMVTGALPPPNHVCGTGCLLTRHTTHGLSCEQFRRKLKTHRFGDQEHGTLWRHRRTLTYLLTTRLTLQRRMLIVHSGARRPAGVSVSGRVNVS